MDPIEKVLIGLLIVFLVPVTVFLFYAMFFLMPVSFYAQAKCLKAGFPSSDVTIGLEMYCKNLDGSVTVKVEKLK